MSKRLNPFEIRAGLKPISTYGVHHVQSLNPFEIRAGLKPHSPARLMPPSSLNPFEIRAGLKPIEVLGFIRFRVLIPLKSGLA